MSDRDRDRVALAMDRQIPRPELVRPGVKTSGGDAPTHPPRRGDLGRLALGALGVVYGDIGTSPLYAIRECVTPPHGVSPTPDNILGILSLVFWSLTLVVTVKYLSFVMRADNNGEGGVLALMALVLAPAKESDPAAAPSRLRRRGMLALVGLFGASLLYGDGMITPAISVLSAIEGLEVATTALSPFVVPITCAILVGVFLLQSRGTGRIGTLFGPVTLCWFIAIAAAGLPWIIERPEILAAVSPVYAVRFLIGHVERGFLVLASVVLCITGAEALYTDMGHFGRRPIRVAWYIVVLPALLISYFGQGALLLQDPNARNPFYALVPGPLLYPMVGIATAAAAVASQALIAGAFSITRQAIQLGYAPRMTIVHTSGRTEGQIFIPEINTIMMVACLALVLGFRASSELAGAYGIAVTGTMTITSILFYVVARDRWRWRRAPALAFLALFLGLDLTFLLSCATKVASGGWFPLAVAAAVFAIMTTWKRGRAILAARVASGTLPVELFVADVGHSRPHRVPGTAIFLTSTSRGTPNVLLHHFKHNKVLHEQVVILSVVTDPVPEVGAGGRVRWKRFGEGFFGVTAHYGFMETPDVPAALQSACKGLGIRLEPGDTSYYLGRETLLPTRDRTLAFWRKRLFGFLSRNARSATDFFKVPPNRVVEIGTQIEL